MISSQKYSKNTLLKLDSPPSPSFSSPSPPPTSSPSSSDLLPSSNLDGFQISLDSIIDLNSLIHFENSILKRLSSFHTDPAQANQARKRIQDFRRQVVQKHYPITALTSTTCPAPRVSSTNPIRDWPEEILNEEIHNHHQPFDRLIYLLQRYIEHCDSIGLPPWPIHHLKVAIWIRGDVISLKTRVVPLRKTVRCYITSLEKVRIMTFDIFPHHPSEGDEKTLMSSQVLREILDQLPINRSTPNDNTASKNCHDSTQTSFSFLNSQNSLDGSDRNSIIDSLRAQSDAQASEALLLVRHARGRGHGAGSSEAIVTKLKPDPHLHTLQRFQSWASELGIPAWPIEPLRVSIWLKQSVLVPGNGPSDGDRHAFKVSLRTVQVYLSRLEFARSRTESLFRDRFGETATTSLYRSQAIIDILESFPTSRSSYSNTMSSPSLSSGLPLIPMVEHQYRPMTTSSASETRLISSSEIQCSPRKRRRGYGAATTDGDGFVVRAVGSHSIHHKEISSVHETEDSCAPSNHEKRIRRRAATTSHLPNETDFKPGQLSTDHQVGIDQELEQQMPVRKKVDKGCISFILCDDQDEDATADKPGANGQSSELADDHFSARSLASSENDWTVSPLSIPRASRTTPLLSSGSELVNKKPKCCIPSFSQFIQSASQHLQ